MGERAVARIGKGITNTQAKYLAALCREAKVPYSGQGMTRQEASIAIGELKARVEKDQEHVRRKYA